MAATSGKNLNARHEAAALALASGKTLKDAAATAGASERSLRNWQQADAFRDRVRDLRAELFALAVARLSSLAGQAADTLQGLLSAESESVRLGAAKAVLELAGKTREVYELEERLRALEARLAAEAGPTGGNHP